MSHPVLDATLKLGQSVWLDFINRELLNSGRLDALIGEGLRGMTSNPTIFQQAISGSGDYDNDIRAAKSRGETPAQTFERVAVTDIVRAADALRKVYEDSGGADGFVSLEVSPKLAHDTQSTIAEARRLWSRVGRPNLLIKVPGTREGLPAILTLLADGINVNVTLIFSLQQYRDVLETYLRAVELRSGRGQSVDRMASVASFFVSRVDSAADKQLEAKGRKDLTAQAAIANACVAYRHFLDVVWGERWKNLAAKGARVQRPLWASTSTKNPSYSDVLYVHELMARDTVNTLPLATLDAWKDHGKPAPRLMENLKTADAVLSEIRAAGVDVDQITVDLIEDGVKKFADSYDQLLTAIEAKLKVM
jgi:transaldolase/glucose-6-phosphate isomerase